MRVEGYGRVDRAAPVRFRFDGREVAGFAGDTVASALLGAGTRLIGRSFKYHRPRGVLTAGSEEPNALVTIGTGAAAEPNLRATIEPIYAGMEVLSQNRWPTLAHDVLGLNNLLAPFLGAGFYYKTFMWPRAFWEKVYEPFIRRAAGLGALSGDMNADHYERAFAFCDVLVIGAGPAGLMAALTAAEGGADVILADEGAAPGGRLLSEDELIDGQSAADWAAETAARLAAMPNVRIMPRTAVTGAYDGGIYGALEQVTPPGRVPEGTPRECFWRIAARRAVLAAGAHERLIAFPNNDRPGIMTAGAVRSYLHKYGVAPGQSVAVFCNNDDAHRTARDLAAAGVRIAALIDTRADARAEGDFPTYTGAEVIGTTGYQGLEHINVRAGSENLRIRTDCLAVSGGWNPALHLTCHMNGRPVWDEGIHAFVPKPDMVPGLRAVGAAGGVFSTHGALKTGAEAAAEALDALGKKAPALDLPEAGQEAGSITPIWVVEGRGRRWLDLQNDVTVKDVRQAAAENYSSVEHMKRYTTQGMATDQGKNSNIAALAVLADATGRAIPETGTTTFRPPYVPVPVAAFGAGAQGKGFAPERLTTSHAASLARNAPMIAVGQWYRPSYFPAPGETTWREACDREVTMVREAVGVCDVSTLGKIDIQGPDAADLLDLVYTNRFSTLKPGRVRYGLMLREDGHVMDDGTTAHLADGHYVMTTTTAGAGAVMRHLDYVLQVLRPDLDVATISATDQWAQFAVAGPKAREVLNAVLDQPLDPDDWPFMSCGAVSVAGTPGRLFRISFSGEEGYEVAVPARFGAALFRLLVATAEGLGGGAYGMEALNVLRIEKGFITHSDIDGRVTAFDVGMDRMISPTKTCIGKPAAAREGLMDPDRPRLVGLRPVEKDGQLTAGGHLFGEGDEAVRVNDQGYVTSVCYSPTAGTYLGLGFLKNGPERMGETVRLVDHLRGVETRAVVSDPVVFDPDGGRMRG